jgi:hypothetical protein
VIFLRKNYQYKLSSYASEDGLLLKPWYSRDFPQKELPVQAFFICQWTWPPSKSLIFLWFSLERITSISFLHMPVNTASF